MKNNISRMEKKAGIRLFITIAPFMAYIFIFSYFPLYGWLYAFYNYHPGWKLSDCAYVGLTYFTDLWSNHAIAMDVLRVLKNSLGQSFLGIFFSPIVPLTAILLTEIKSSKFRRTVQTLTTLPNFISWVLMYSVIWSAFSMEDGFVNNILRSLHLIDSPIDFLGNPSHMWLKMMAYALWKGLGWGCIIYMAAIMGIDQELYEAAIVDGAGRFRRIWHITVPGVLPTYFVLLILSISGIISGGAFEQLFLFQTPLNRDTLETLDLYIYNSGLLGGRYSPGIAVGILKSVVSIILIATANSLSKVTRGESIF